MFKRYSPPRIKIVGYKRDDCTVNGIANGLGISYDLARKILQTVTTPKSFTDGAFYFRKNNPLPKSKFHIETHVKNVCKFITSEIIVPKKENGMKLTLAEFAKEFNKDRYIVLVTGHLTSVNKGVIYDTWDPSERKVQVAYRVDVKESKEIIKELAKYYRMSGVHLEDHLNQKEKIS